MIIRALMLMIAFTLTLPHSIHANDLGRDLDYIDNLGPTGEPGDTGNILADAAFNTAMLAATIPVFTVAKGAQGVETVGKGVANGVKRIKHTVNSHRTTELFGEQMPLTTEEINLGRYNNSEDTPQLEGNIPENILKLKDLTKIDLSGHQLSGEIPKFLGGIKGLETLYLPGNDFTGEVPLSLCNLKSLKHLSLGGNPISGPLILSGKSHLKDVIFPHTQIDALMVKNTYYYNKDITNLLNEGSPLRCLCIKGVSQTISNLDVPPIYMDANAFQTPESWRNIYVRDFARIAFSLPENVEDRSFPQYLKAMGITDKTVITYGEIKHKTCIGREFTFTDINATEDIQEALRASLIETSEYQKKIPRRERFDAMMKRYYNPPSRAKSARN